MASVAMADERAAGEDETGVGTTIEASTVEARVLDGERRVVLTISGEDVAGTDSVVFDVWSDRTGREGLVRHGAVRLDDGS